MHFRGGSTAPVFFYLNICQGLSKGLSRKGIISMQSTYVNMWIRTFGFPITNKWMTVSMSSQKFLFEKENAIKSGADSLIYKAPDTHQCIPFLQRTCGMLFYIPENRSLTRRCGSLDSHQGPVSFRFSFQKKFRSTDSFPSVGGKFSSAT